MRKMLLAMIVTAALTGCAGMGHKPPTCDGPLRPINPPQYYQPQPLAPPTIKGHDTTKGEGVNHG